MKNKLYVLIDKNLDPIYGAVQGGHAVAQWILDYWQLNKEGDPEWDWHNDYLIYLSVDIDEWYDRIKRFDPCKFQWSEFREPDLNNKMTAIAIYEKDFPGFIKRGLNKEELLK